MLKRCYYIANSYDGAYFVLTDDIQEYVQRMASYVINLENSSKINHYSFGSVEMTALEYDRLRNEAQGLESSLIKQKKDESELTVTTGQEEEMPSGPKKKKNHLRLV